MKSSIIIFSERLTLITIIIISIELRTKKKMNIKISLELKLVDFSVSVDTALIAICGYWHLVVLFIFQDMMLSSCLLDQKALWVL